MTKRLTTIKGIEKAIQVAKLTPDTDGRTWISRHDLGSETFVLPLREGGTEKWLNYNFIVLRITFITTVNVGVVGDVNFSLIKWIPCYSENSWTIPKTLIPNGWNSYVLMIAPMQPDAAYFTFRSMCPKWAQKSLNIYFLENLAKRYFLNRPIHTGHAC